VLSFFRTFLGPGMVHHKHKESVILYHMPIFPSVHSCEMRAANPSGMIHSFASAIPVALSIVILIGCGQIRSQSQSFDDVLTIPKKISLDDEQISARGKWMKIGGNQYKTPSINSARITCNLKALTCVEHRAVLTSSADQPHFADPGMLFSEMEEYRIVSWKDNVLHARSETRVYDTDLRISIDDNLIEKTSRETRARGVQAADPDNWLQERIAGK